MPHSTNIMVLTYDHANRLSNASYPGEDSDAGTASATGFDVIRVTKPGDLPSQVQMILAEPRP